MKTVWTESAVEELNFVFEYYKREVNSHPFIGQVEETLKDLGLSHRYLVEGNFKIIYRVFEKQIFITDFFDTSQDPAKLKNKERRLE